MTNLLFVRIPIITAIFSILLGLLGFAPLEQYLMIVWGVLFASVVDIRFVGYDALMIEIIKFRCDCSFIKFIGKIVGIIGWVLATAWLFSYVISPKLLELF
jgi:hypothetical protein